MSRDGDPAAFEFVSYWELSAARQPVWEALVDFNAWPVWWPGLQSVIETIQGDVAGIGQKATAVWRGPVGYSLRMSIEAVERVQPDFLRGVASGDVVGEGTWRLDTTGEHDIFIAARNPDTFFGFFFIDRVKALQINTRRNNLDFIRIRVIEPD